MPLVFTNRRIWEGSCHCHTWLLPDAYGWLVLQGTCHVQSLKLQLLLSRGPHSDGKQRKDVG